MNDILSFFVEMWMLWLLAKTGYHLADTPLYSWMLAVALPLVASIVWGIWLAPNSSRRLGRVGLLITKAVLFTITALVALTATSITTVIVFLVCAYVSITVAFARER